MGNETEKRRPSGKWYALPIILFVVAIAAGIYGTAGFIGKLFGEKQTFNIPASQESLIIRDAGIYNIGYESFESTSEFLDKRLKVTITSKANGQAVALRKINYNYTYSEGGISGTMLWDFQVDVPGDYVVSVEPVAEKNVAGASDMSGRLIIKKELGKSIVAYVVTSLLSGLTLCGAVAAFVVILILRTTRKNPPPVV